MISLHYAETTIFYEGFSMLADGEALVHSLRQALRYRELVKEGTVTRNDFRERFSEDV